MKRRTKDPLTTASSELAERKAFDKFPILEKLARIGESVPQQSWDEVPRDLSGKIDHYVYGLPKR